MSHKNTKYTKLFFLIVAFVALWETIFQNGTAAHWAKITDLALHP